MIGSQIFWHKNIKMVCPYCQTKGYIETRRTIKKKGISGSKATAGFITGGLSLFVTGLSKKEQVTEVKCTHCNTEWTI